MPRSSPNQSARTKRTFPSSEGWNWNGPTSIHRFFAALPRVLRERGPQSDCGDYGLLRRFERARREDIAALELTTHGLEKLFSYQAVWMAGLRNMGLTLTDAQPWLKNRLVRHAAA